MKTYCGIVAPSFVSEVMTLHQIAQGIHQAKQAEATVVTTACDKKCEPKF